jgi:hypothetical protein
VIGLGGGCGQTHQRQVQLVVLFGFPPSLDYALKTPQKRTRENDAGTATRLLQTNVDAAQYGPVYRDGWHKASIDFADDDEDVPETVAIRVTGHKSLAHQAVLLRAPVRISHQHYGRSPEY